MATISLLLSLPPVFCRDSKARATNNNFRVLHSLELADVVPRPAAAEVLLTVLEVAIMTKVQEVQVPWTTLMLLA